ncbi:MAG: pyridoxal phosphate-dependent aminotransferase [Candidatus Eiseniibacteriota bacterium]
MPEISRRGQIVPPSPIRKLVPLADAAKARGIHVYHVNIGQPDLPTPEPMRRAVARYAAEVYAYAPSPGIRECREALHAYFCRSLGIDFALEDVMITTAGSEAIQLALGTCLEPGQTVLVPEPLYPNYLGFAALLGVEVRPIPCELETGYHLPPDLERFVVPGTRAILFANPGNPTGAVFTREELERVAELAARHDLFVIADEVYREIVYERPSLSILQMEEIGERAIVIDSLSKRYSACGIRIGALVSRNRAVMEAFGRFAMARLSSPALGQVAAAAIAEIPDDYFDTVRATYRARRDAVVTALRTIPGVECYVPEGALYTMARLPVADSEDFTRFLLTSFELDGETTMLTPGNGFFVTPGRGVDDVRVAFVLQEAHMRRAMEIMAAGLAAYRARALNGAAAGTRQMPSKT